MSPKKCNFFCKEVKYLGHVVSEMGVQTDPEKLDAVKNWPVPKSKIELKSFLGLCTNYRKLVKNFEDIAKPLHRLTENEKIFVWTEEAEHSFEELKRKLMESPILSYPSVNTEFILDTDASNFAIGAVLSQIQQGWERVVAYCSKTLGKAEKNYYVTRKELLAIVKSIEYFHHNLHGRRFLLKTDHAALRWLLSFKNPEGQIARWIKRVQGYDFEVKHREGRLHQNADRLSRRPCESQDCARCKRLEEKTEENGDVVLRTLCETLDFEEWAREQEEDEEIGFILSRKKEGRRPNWQEISDRNTGIKYLVSIWDSLEMYEDLLFRKWESPDGKSNKWLLMVPREMGRNFESAVFKRLMVLLGIKKTRTTPLHPQSDGLVERLIRTLLQYLSMFVADHQRDWDDWIPLFLLSYRSSRHEEMKNTSSMILTGREFRLPMDFQRGLPPDSRYEEDEFVQQTREKVWLYQPQRTKGKCPKLQSAWEGPYVVQDRLNDIMYRYPVVIRGRVLVIDQSRELPRSLQVRSSQNFFKKETLKPQNEELRGRTEVLAVEVTCQLSDGTTVRGYRTEAGRINGSIVVGQQK
ncbi:uncharacterized protein LOC143261229 [Megalopta genalis]|uniref:uncharacterized protein LOC143261229 n=1 Tax=Megalopta genalis TaxID=115081 RepID=UPI003FD2CD26